MTFLKNSLSKMASVATLSAALFGMSNAAYAGPFDIAGAQINNWRIAISSPGSDLGLRLTEGWKGKYMWSAGTVDARSNAGFSHADFFSGGGANGALLTAIAGGSRTSTGTAYSRAELREMKATGGEAAWSCTSTRSMTFHGMLASVPAGKRVSIGQIHDGASDNVQVFIQDSRIYAHFNDSGAQEDIDLTTNYVVGHRYQITIGVNSSGVAVTYKNMTLNSAPFTTRRVALSPISGSCYFKAGVYLQFCAPTDLSAAENNKCTSKPASQKVSDPKAFAQARIYTISLSNPQ